MGRNSRENGSTFPLPFQNNNHCKRASTTTGTQDGGLTIFIIGDKSTLTCNLNSPPCGRAIKQVHWSCVLITIVYFIFVAFEFDVPSIWNICHAYFEECVCVCMCDGEAIVKFISKINYNKIKTKQKHYLIQGLYCKASIVTCRLWIPWVTLIIIHEPIHKQFLLKFPIVIQKELHICYTYLAPTQGIHFPLTM